MAKKFTLIELLCIISVISILVSMLLPSIRDSRVKVQMSVCLSNLHQLGKANSLFLKDNNFKFISRYDIDSINPGHLYVGTGLAKKKKQRPLNKYLGGPSTWTDEVMAVAVCPMSSEEDRIYYRDRFENSYMGASRGEHNDDLDGDGWDPLSQAEIINPSTMVVIASTGAWHFANTSVGKKWKIDNHGDRRYTFSFVDGSSKIYKIYGTEGVTGSGERINFRNFAN